MSERSYDGPSCYLPPGALLCQMSVARFREKLVASVTDRRDFYHQAKVTSERAHTNLLPFCFAADELSGTNAYLEFSQKVLKRQKGCREEEGDKLGFVAPHGKSVAEPPGLFAGFRSLFQGDHLGVEFALAAHQSLLEGAELLRDGEQVRGHCMFPTGPIYSGLIIDDFFLIGREAVKQQNLNSEAARALSRAREVYRREGLLGSDEKDIVASDRFKAAGAEVISDRQAVSLGYVTVGAPVSKRLALSALSLRVAALPGISTQLIARLSGNWNSVLMFRRCLSSIVDDLFAAGSRAEESGVREVFPLSRKIARELVLLSSLAPLMVSNAATQYSGTVLASDASLAKGAVVKAEIDPALTEVLWLDTDKKGSSVALDNGFRQCLRHLGEEPLLEEGAPEELVRPKASPLLYFDFVEICGGVGAVSKAAADLGLSVAPPLDLSFSRHYDLGCLRMFEWVIMMVAEGRFRSFLISPPCTTFSPAAYPSLRSYALPYGYDRLHPRVIHGNCLAFRSLVLLRVGRRHRRPCGAEQPRRSKMRWLREWKSLVASGKFEEAIIAACNFGSPHQKEFCFLVYLLSKDALQRKCTRDHSHVRIQGAFTKKSAAYTKELGVHLALEFKNALRRQAILADHEFLVDGLESVIVNDVAQTSKWREVSAWSWKKPRHINVLEVSSAVSGMSKEATLTPHSRFLSLVDSSVARGSLSKGRSTSRLLQPLLKRSAVTQIGFDLYPVFPFCPTRLNVADDPTRDVEIRLPTRHSIRELASLDLRALHRSGLRRFAANWLRLVILVIQFGNAESLKPVWNLAGICAVTTFDFIHSLLAALLSGLWILSWICLLAHFLIRAKPCRSLGFCLLFSGVSCTGIIICLGSWNLSRVAAMAPGSIQERKRAEQRHGVVLTEDRVALDVTRSRRRKLLSLFQIWLWNNRGVSLLYLLNEKPADPEKISKWLVEYGREMYKSGKTYNSYAETVNAVAGARPQIRKQLTQAWDFAFSWISNEPGDHHPAMPAGILVALMSLALFWGWPQVAAVFGLAWAGVLRIGEVLQATRSDLVLPKDAIAGTSFALLKIKEPKTRGRHARHQSARIDPVDIIKILEIAYERAEKQSPLWSQSAATLRKRLKDLLEALHLPTEAINGVRPFDLSSFRPGGASWLLMSTENSDLVRRRGRWLSNRIMEIYLQEVQYITYLERLPQSSRKIIDVCTASFTDVLRQVSFFADSGIPCEAWFFLLQGRREMWGDDGGSFNAAFGANMHRSI